MSPELKPLYPKNWTKISYEFRKSKNFQCEDCGVKQGDRRINRKTGEVKTVYVVASHKNHDERHLPDAPLICRCPSCHIKADLPYRRRNVEVNHQRRLHRQLLLRRSS